MFSRKGGKTPSTPHNDTSSDTNSHRASVDATTETTSSSSLHAVLKQKGLFSTYKRYMFKLNLADGTLTKFKHSSSKSKSTATTAIDTFSVSDATNVQVMPGMNLSGKANTIAVFRKGHSPMILLCENEIEYAQWMRALELCNSGRNHEDSSTSLRDDVTDVDDVKQKRDNMLSALEAVLDASVISDDRGFIVGFNRGAEQMFGWKKEDIVGRNVKELMPESYANYHDTFLDNYYQTGHKKLIGIPRSLIAKHKDGTTFSVQLSLGEVANNHRAPTPNSSSDELHSHTGDIAFIAMFRSVNQEHGEESEDVHHQMHKSVTDEFNSAKDKMHNTVKEFMSNFKTEIQEQHTKVDSKVTILQNKLEILEKENQRLKNRLRHQVEQEKLLEEELSILQETTHRIAIKRVLRHVAACEQLKEYCQSQSREYSNAVNFYLTAESFAQKFTAHSSLVEEEALGTVDEKAEMSTEALDIFHSFIMCDHGVESPIPVSEAVVQYLQNHMSTPTATMFLPVQTDMIDVLRRSIYKGFISSSHGEKAVTFLRSDHS